MMTGTLEMPRSRLQTSTPSKSGQHDVEQNQVGLILFEQINPLIAFVSNANLVAFVAQFQFDKTGNIDVVFNNQNLQACHLSSNRQPFNIKPIQFQTV